jgi:arylsulfatase A-like enzyme
MKRKILRTLTTLLLAPLAPTTRAAEAPPPPVGKPNIVFLLADDLRPDCLGVLGHPIVKTPNVDKLVGNGFIFRNAYTLGSNVGAVCMPSRTMILTGQSYLRRRPGTPTLAQTVKAAGYASMRSGKYGNSPKALDDGFDQHLDGGNADGNVDNLMGFVKQHAGRQPLFLSLASHEPHDPQFAPQEYYAKYNAADIPLPVNFLPFQPFDNGEIRVRDEKTLPWPRTKENVTGKLARYYASTTFWDAQVGRLITALQQAGQYDNSIFIVAGDNGLCLGEHGLLGKQNLYEFGGMHVPLIFAGPGIPKGETKAFAYLMDIYPTVCEMTGMPAPESLDAKSLVPVITGKAPKVRDYCFTAYKECQRAIRDDRWKLIRYPLIDKTQLFDLQADPHEMNDLAGQPEQAGRINEMLGLLKTQQQRYNDNAPLQVASPQDAAWSPGKVAGGKSKKNREK